MLVSQILQPFNIMAPIPNTLQLAYLTCLNTRLGVFGGLIITLPEKGQLAALPELQNYQPHQSFEQSHAESHIE